MTEASLNNRARIWAQRFSDLSDIHKRHAMANYSIAMDKPGFNEQVAAARDIKVFRLAHKLGIRGNTNTARFAADFEKFGARPSANYDIRGRVFSSLSDGTYWTGAPVADPRVAKVKTFLRRHLTREPTDKDIDWVVYLFFGSDRFDDEYSGAMGDLFYGMQNSFYDARGRRKERNAGNNFDNDNLPPIRRNQRRISSWRIVGNRSTYRYHGGDRLYNWLSNSNSNSGLGSNSNSNSPGTRANKNRNKNEKNKRIQWSKVTLNNLPENGIIRAPFSNGNKAVKLSWKNTVGKTHFQFLAPQTFRDMAKMSMTNAFNKAGNFTFTFKNPFTRGTVKRSNIDFIILTVNKRKTAAATKIQKVVRGSQARTKIRRNAERATKLASIVQRTAAKKNNKKRATARTARAERKEKLRSKRSRKQ